MPHQAFPASVAQRQTSAAVASGRPSAAHRRKGRGPRRVSPDEKPGEKKGMGDD